MLWLTLSNSIPVLGILTAQFRLNDIAGALRLGRSRQPMGLLVLRRTAGARGAGRSRLRWRRALGARVCAAHRRFVSGTGTCWRVEGHPQNTLYSVVLERRYVLINRVLLNRSVNQLPLRRQSAAFYVDVRCRGGLDERRRDPPRCAATGCKPPSTTHLGGGSSLTGRQVNPSPVRLLR